MCLFPTETVPHLEMDDLVDEFDTFFLAGGQLFVVLSLEKIQCFCLWSHNMQNTQVLWFATSSSFCEQRFHSHAGSETTANTLAFMFNIIGQRPDIAEK